MCAVRRQVGRGAQRFERRRRWWFPDSRVLRCGRSVHTTSVEAQRCLYASGACRAITTDVGYSLQITHIAILERPSLAISIEMDRNSAARRFKTESRGWARGGSPQIMQARSCWYSGAMCWVVGTQEDQSPRKCLKTTG